MLIYPGSEALAMLPRLTDAGHLRGRAFAMTEKINNLNGTIASTATRRRRRTDTDAATEYGLLPRQQPLDTTAEQGDATTEVPDSESSPPPPAWRAESLDAAIPVEC